MKYTILLDSTTTKLCVGLANENQVLETIIYDCWQAQSEHMIPELYSLLEKYDVLNEDISSVAVAIGPGSYTGVRIAITIAKTIAAVLKCKLFAISSLQTLKDGNNPSICLINARSGRSYIGVYKNNETILEDQIMTNEQVLDYIRNNSSYSICGQVDYLGLKSKNNNSIEEMFSLLKYKDELDNPLGLKPVYMKD